MRKRGHEKKKDPASIPAVLRRLVCRVEARDGGGLQDFSVIMVQQ